MYLQQLQSAFHHRVDGESLRKFSGVSFLAPQNPPSMEILGSALPNDWNVQAMEGSGKGGNESGGLFGDEKHGMGVVNPAVEEDGESAAEGRESKLCARGHWRPSEDAKLKELVAQYGPQNWNLIAEKLEGRSGNLEMRKYREKM